MKNLLNCIQNNQIEMFRAEVFNQTCGELAGGGTYTNPLSEDEEVAIIKNIERNDGNSEAWLKVINEYVQHYPLSNTSAILIYRHPNGALRTTLLQHITLYGYNTDEARELCKQLFDEDCEDTELIEVFCKNGRIFYKEIYDTIFVKDEKWAEVYKGSIEARRSVS